MPSFNPQTQQQKARNANSVTIMVGDQIIGFAQTTNHAGDFGTQGFYGIGSAKPQEIQQLRVAPNITIDSFALTDTGLQALGYSNNFATLLANNQFDIHVVDGLTNDPIFTYVGCTAQNYSENIPANQPITDAFSFLAMDVLDKNGNSIMDVTGAYNIPSGQATTGANGLGIAA